MEYCQFAKYKLLMAVTIKSAIFWEGMPCSSVNISVELTPVIIRVKSSLFLFVLSGLLFWLISQSSSLHMAYPAYCYILLMVWLIILYECGNNIFFQNIKELFQEYTVTQCHIREHGILQRKFESSNCIYIS
jgi:hypothetical protein